MSAGSFTTRGLIVMVAVTAVLMGGGCAAFKPADVNGPASNAPVYPVTLSDAGPRLEEASVAWYQLSQRYGLPGKTEANLHPYTATLESLPGNLPAPIYLSTVSTAAVFFAIGSVKSLWSLMAWWRSGLETLTIGLFAAVLAFAAGMIVERVTA